jgi:hypothetical protein
MSRQSRRQRPIRPQLQERFSTFPHPDRLAGIIFAIKKEKGQTGFNFVKRRLGRTSGIRELVLELYMRYFSEFIKQL